MNIKKIKYFLIILFIFMTTGCVDYNMNMKINKDKSMEFSLIETIDQSKFDSKDINTDKYTDRELKEIQLYTKNNFDNVKKSMKNRGYFVLNNYIDPKNKNKKGVKITKLFKNIDNISQEGDIIVVDLSKITENSFNDNVFFTVKKQFLYNTYTASFIIEKPNIEIDKISKYQNNFNIKYQIELPVKAIKSNATSKSNDNKLLSWNINITKTNNIQYSFKLPNTNNFYLLYSFISLIILILIILIIITIKIIKSNFTNNTFDDEKEIILEQRNNDLKEINNQFKEINPEKTVPKIIKPIDNSIIINNEKEQKNDSSIELLEESTLMIPKKEELSEEYNNKMQNINTNEQPLITSIPESEPNIIDIKEKKISDNQINNNVTILSDIVIEPSDKK